jgi:ribosome-associated heat shock protein Hsp15
MNSNTKTDDKVRIDKWLWAVRLFKTRSMASDACKKNKIVIDGNNVKPSHTVKIGEEIEIKGFPITRKFKVTGLIENRVSAKLAVEFVTEITSTEELEKLKTIKSDTAAFREKGTGRPTKRERRRTDLLHDIERF